MKDRGSAFRILILFLFAVITVIVGYLFGCLNHIIFNKSVILVFLNIVFLLIFFIGITRKRLLGNIYTNTTYIGLLAALIINYLLLFISSRLSDFYFPYIIISIIFSMVLSESLALSLSIYLTIIYSICFGLSSNTVYGYLILSIVGVILSEYLKSGERKNKYILGIAIMLANYLVGVFFTYLNNYSVGKNELLWLCGSSAFVCLFFVFLFIPVSNVFSREKNLIYEVIVDENYPLLLDIKKISILEYNHAIRIANIAGDCAELIGADKMLSMAGGLYYNAINIIPDKKEGFFKYLNNRCFPLELITLLMDRSESAPPRNKEASIVHMIDTIMVKLEVVYKKADKSNWNTSMIVYQTLNECSSNGLYDNAGLSMNEFLKIRDYLAALEYSL